MAPPGSLTSGFGIFDLVYCDKIWTMNIDGSNKKMVSPDHGVHTCSFYYPGGQSIVFASTSHLGSACPPKPTWPGHIRYAWPLYPYDIYRANPDGSDLTALTNNPKYDAEPIVSSDGKWIVFGSQREGDFDIYRMDADGSNVKRLTDTLGYDGGPWISPDGTKIAWRAWHPQTAAEKAQWRENMEKDYIESTPLDIWVMDADGSNKKRLTNNGAYEWSPTWSPDGQLIAFTSTRDHHETYDVYVMASDGSGQTRLTLDPANDIIPRWWP